MKLTHLCIKRPVMTVMMILTIVVLGIFSFVRLGIDLYPNVEFPFVLVNTVLAGSGPEEIETSVTKIIEEGANTIEGIDEMNSYSAEGVSTVMIKFDMEKNVDVAAQDVRDKVAGVQRDLPDGFEPPVISKLEMGAIPVLNIAVYGDRGLVDLTEITRKKIKEQLENVGGVGSVDMIGGRQREIHIVVDPVRLSALNISIKDLKEAVQQQNIEIPGGRVEQESRDYTLRTLGRIKSVRQFNDIVIKTVNSSPIRISDVARVEDTGEYMTDAAYFNGQPCVNVEVVKQSGSNTVEVVRRVKDKLAIITPYLPGGVRYSIVADQSVYIKASVSAVEEHLVLGSIFAALAVLLFLGDWRSTIISSLAIPTSIIGTFTILDLLGFTLNNITLLALTIAVGIVIDDAIVMLENIYRHMDEYGKTPLKAALEGADEISFAVITMSASLLVIFIPLAFMSGIVGRFFKSYGLTIAGAIVISTFVALTLTPMLSSLFLKVKHGAKGRLEKFTDHVNDSLARPYIAALEWALANRWKMILLFIGISLSALPMLKGIGKDFAPQEDTSQFIVNINAPEGTSIRKMQKIMRQLEGEIKTMPHILNLLTTIGISNGFQSASSNQASITVELVDVTKRKEGMAQIMSAVRKLFGKYKELRMSVNVAGGFGGNEKQMEFMISGPDLNKLREYADAVAARLRKTPGFVDVDLSVSFAKPEYTVEIDREKAHGLKVKISDIANALRTMVGGEEDITKYKEGEELYEVRIRAEAEMRNSIETISAMAIPTEDKKLVRLDSVATIKPAFGPTQIEHTARLRRVTVESNLEGVPLNRAYDICRAEFALQNAPKEYVAMPRGKGKELQKMLASFVTAFAMAFIFIYLILAAQFESFIYPVSIMSVLPLTIPFAIITLFISREPLSMFSILGIFMLVGIVKKNSILQIDYTNTLRAKGYKRYDAMLSANKTRLRPILMTTLTIIAGMLPTALSKGAGAEVRGSMAWVIIGGQALSLFVTLLMAPVMYSVMDDFQQWLENKFNIKLRRDQLDFECVERECEREAQKIKDELLKKSQHVM
ncbi:MAG: efflux RND transporter permease subunit [Elusimicrobiaceae bacterium]|nr:efflux RND transporter permease subunit [Elusimicrobiaceae bacterium]